MFLETLRVGDPNLYVVQLAFISRSSNDNTITLTISFKNVWRLSIENKSLQKQVRILDEDTDIIYQGILLYNSESLIKLVIIVCFVYMLNTKKIVKNVIQIRLPVQGLFEEDYFWKYKSFMIFLQVVPNDIPCLPCLHSFSNLELLMNASKETLIFIEKEKQLFCESVSPPVIQINSQQHQLSWIFIIFFSVSLQTTLMWCHF